MARSAQTIFQSIITQIQNNPTLVELNSVSQTALYALIAYIIATSQNTEETLNDALVTQVQAIGANLPPTTLNWLEQEIFNFQYSVSNPQVIQFSTASIVPFYPIINPSLQIINNVFLTANSLTNQVDIKVATGTPPSPLNSDQLAALQFYVTQIGTAGISYICSSTAADLIYCQVTVFFQGAYASTIGASLLAAYTDYISNISFGGTIKVVDLLLALRVVPNVNNVEINNLFCRAFYQPFEGGQNLVVDNNWLQTTYIAQSGYFNDEASPNDFLTVINLIPQ